MILTEKKQYDRDYILADQGLHQAVCVDQFEGMTEFLNRDTGERLTEEQVIAAGITQRDDGVWMGVPDTVKKRDTIWLGFELDQNTPEDDKPLSIRKKFTASIHERATLRVFLERWRGRPFTDGERAKFDTETLIGVPCQLNIIHKDFGSGPRQLIDFAIKETGESMKPSGHYVRNKDKEPKSDETPTPQTSPQEAEKTEPVKAPF
jgi:hypothetical protein